MKKFVATLFITALLAVSALGQSDPPPTLRIVTESPGLPSELFYGNIKVKPLRFRPGTTTPITIDDHDFFIQQQYIDFLRRFPEADGLKFYVDILNGCVSTDTECLKYTRGALAANFFRSPEFKNKGLFVMYLYMVSVGQRASTVAELSDATKIERPHYSEFMTDVQSITSPDDRNGPDQAKLAALTVSWLQRPEIQTKYGSLTNDQFVKALEATAGVTVSNESALINALNGASMTRAQALRNIVESPEVNAKFYKQAFVTMEYFGFLRRDPEDCHQQANWFGSSDGSGCGYIFHNNRYKQLEPALTGDMTENFIVRGFEESPEYRGRF
jgi:hypothetical protein